MKNEEIEIAVRERNYCVPSLLYISICRSPQVDHVQRDGDWYDIWTMDGWHWRVKVYPVWKGVKNYEHEWNRH